MNALDYTMLAVLGISALLGLLRGFVRETVSLLVWIAAFWVAMSFSIALAKHLSGFMHNPSLRVAVSFAVLFVLVLMAGVIINYLLASLLKKAGVGTSDRILGVMFGLARGVLVVALVMILVELTPLVESASWRGSTIVGLLQPMLAHVEKLLPADLHASVFQGFGGPGR
jgi:membrane protein required for colicin V production